jgi:hypothetical protein
VTRAAAARRPSQPQADSDSEAAAARRPGRFPASRRSRCLPVGPGPPTVTRTRYAMTAQRRPPRRRSRARRASDPAPRLPVTARSPLRRSRWGSVEHLPRRPGPIMTLGWPSLSRRVTWTPPQGSRPGVRVGPAARVHRPGARGRPGYLDYIMITGMDHDVRRSLASWESRSFHWQVAHPAAIRVSGWTRR